MSKKAVLAKGDALKRQLKGDDVALGNSTVMYTNDPRVKTMKKAMTNKMLSVYTQKQMEARMHDDDWAKRLDSGTSIDRWRSPAVTIYKAGRSRGAGVRRLAVQSSKDSDLSLLLHSSLQRHFGGNPGLLKDRRGVISNRGGVYQKGLRKLSSENFKKKSKRRLLDLI